MPLVTSNPLIDTVLARYSDLLGAEASAYRNHVYRGLNYQLRILDSEATDLLALAWVGHDLGLWTDHTLDYLPPSLRLGRELAAEFRVDDIERLQMMIQFHHRVRRIADPVAESFRVADRADAWQGRWRRPLHLEDIDGAVRQFPYCGFHRFLRQSLVAYAIRHPLRPLPMFLW